MKDIWLLALVLVLFILLVLVAVYRLANDHDRLPVNDHDRLPVNDHDRLPVIGGGVKHTRLPDTHLVVDTLNLAHWLRSSKSNKIHQTKPIDTKEIISAIDETAPILRRQYKEVIYVLKDQEAGVFNSQTAVRADLQATAERNRVQIAMAEQSDFDSVSKNKTHSSRGRDDFYMCLLAKKYRSAVATEDRLRDFDEFRQTVAPFHTVNFVYWRALPERDFIRPSSSTYERLKKPHLVKFSSLQL